MDRTGQDAASLRGYKEQYLVAIGLPPAISYLHSTGRRVLGERLSLLIGRYTTGSGSSRTVLTRGYYIVAPPRRQFMAGACCDGALTTLFCRLPSVVKNMCCSMCSFSLATEEQGISDGTRPFFGLSPPSRTPSSPPSSLCAGLGQPLEIVSHIRVDQSRCLLRDQVDPSRFLMATAPYAWEGICVPV